MTTARSLAGIRGLERSRSLAVTGVASELGAEIANQALIIFDLDAALAEATKQGEAKDKELADLKKQLADLIAERQGRVPEGDAQG